MRKLIDAVCAAPGNSCLLFGFLVCFSLVKQRCCDGSVRGCSPPEHRGGQEQCFVPVFFLSFFLLCFGVLCSNRKIMWLIKILPITSAELINCAELCRITLGWFFSCFKHSCSWDNVVEGKPRFILDRSACLQPPVASWRQCSPLDVG